MQILICDYLFWTKQDPTEFDAKSNTIRVRSNYDVELDSCGWLVHERIRALLHDAGFVDDYNPPLIQYPDNAVERMAYTWQFVYLIESRLVKNLNDIKQMMPWKFERYGDEWAKKYWSYAKTIAKDDDPDMPPSMMYEGGRLNPPWGEQRYEESFRCIVEEAKAKRKACSGKC